MRKWWTSPMQPFFTPFEDCSGNFVERERNASFHLLSSILVCVVEIFWVAGSFTFQATLSFTAHRDSRCVDCCYQCTQTHVTKYQPAFFGSFEGMSEFPCQRAHLQHCRRPRDLPPGDVFPSLLLAKINYSHKYAKSIV